MEKNRFKLHQEAIKSGYKKNYTDFTNNNFNSFKSAKEFYDLLVKDLYSKNPETTPTWEDWAAMYCCDLSWAKSQSYCKAAAQNELLKQFPECVRYIGKLMLSKSTNKPIIVATVGMYDGFFFYPSGTFSNTKTNKSGTYECDENGEIKINYRQQFNSQQFEPQSAKKDTTQTAQTDTTQNTQQSDQKRNTTFRLCSGEYEFGCYNSTAIARVQECLGLVVTGYFGKDTLNKLKQLGYEKFTDADINTICSKASQPINEGLKLTPLVTK